MEPQEIPTQQIKEKLRQTLEPQIFGFSKEPQHLSEEDEDLVVLKTGFDIYNIPITSYQKFMQPAIIGLRKLVRKLLKPVLEKQVNYNFTNTQIIQNLTKQIKELKQNQTLLETEIKTLKNEIQNLNKTHKNTE